MPAQRRFFLALPAGLALAFAAYFGLAFFQLGTPTVSSWWCYEINHRKLALAEKIETPKLLVVGGSSTLFGINAGQLETRLGVPAINLGTHAALGLPYILELARSAAKPGDTVLLVPEYELYRQSHENLRDWADAIYLDYVVARDPGYLKRLPGRDQYTVFMLLPFERLKAGFKNRFKTPHFPQIDPSGSNIYDPGRVNDHGDLTGHTRSRIPAHIRPDLGSSYLASGVSASDKGFKVLRDFCDWARAHQVRVLVTFPNLCDRPEYESPVAQQGMETIRRFFESLDVPVIGTVREALLPRSDFFDTCYHLTEEAAQARTARLVPQLHPFFPTAAHSTNAAPEAGTALRPQTGGP